MLENGGVVLKGAKEIGRYIGMSIATFHRHKDKDSIPYYRAGRTIVARSEDLDEWMEKQMSHQLGIPTGYKMAKDSLAGLAEDTKTKRAHIADYAAR